MHAQVEGNLVEAPRMLEKALAIFMNTLGPNHPLTKRARRHFDDVG